VTVTLEGNPPAIDTIVALTLATPASEIATTPTAIAASSKKN
jgi:hypothetical protein